MTFDIRLGTISSGKRLRLNCVHFDAHLRASAQSTRTDRRISPTTNGMRRAVPLRMYSTTDELEDRINVRKYELMAKLAEFKADTKAEASTDMETVKAKLAKLEHSLKDGWDNMTEAVKTQLNDWLAN